MHKVIKEEFDIETELLPDTLIEEMRLDSLDLIRFLFLLDQETGVEIPDEILLSDEIQTIADLGAYIDKNRS